MALERLRPARPRSISPTRCASDQPRAFARARRAAQNSGSSDRLVRWPAIVTERLVRALGGLLAGADHVLGPPPLVELLGGQETQRQSCFLETGVLLLRLLRHLGRLVVADMGCQ